MHPQPPFHSQTLNFRRIRNKLKSSNKIRNLENKDDDEFGFRVQPPKSAPLPRKSYNNNYNQVQYNEFVNNFVEHNRPRGHEHTLLRGHNEYISRGHHGDEDPKNNRSRVQDHTIPRGQDRSKSRPRGQYTSNTLPRNLSASDWSLNNNNEYSELRSIVMRIEEQQRRAQDLESRIGDSKSATCGRNRQSNWHKKRQLYFDYVPNSVMQR